MSQLTDIIIKSGLVPGHMLEEMRRWGMPVEGWLPSDVHADPDLTRICEAIDEAVQSQGYVISRETDLEAIPQFLKTMAASVLHVMMEDGKLVPFECQVGVTPSGDFIIPWRTDSIADLMTNGDTFLRREGQKVFFSVARELFYGSNKAFLICTPSTKEPDGQRE